MKNALSHISLKLPTALTKALFIVLVLCTAPATEYAQTPGGANYSLFGFGDMQDNTGALYDGLAGTAIAVPSQYGINTVNPAAWNTARSTRFQTGFSFRQSNIANATNSVNQNGGFLQGFMTLFSIDTTLGISASFGIIPQSNVSYAYSVPQTFIVDGAFINTRTRFVGSGGLTGAYLGTAVQILPGLSIGALAQYDFGVIRSIRAVAADTLIAAVSTTVDDNFSGLTGRFGIQYTGLEYWTFGAVASLSTPLTALRRSQFSLSFSADSVKVDTLQIELPLVLGVGIGRRFGRVSVYADALTKDFTRLNYRKQRDDVSFRRSNRISLGVSYSGSNDYGATFLENITYNIGFGYHQQYYQIGNVGIDEVYGSFGIQVPITRRASVDLALTGGVRGTTNNGLLRETFGRLSVSVNIGEIWFQPFFRE